MQTASAGGSVKAAAEMTAAELAEAVETGAFCASVQKPPPHPTIKKVTADGGKSYAEAEPIEIEPELVSQIRDGSISPYEGCKGGLDANWKPVEYCAPGAFACGAYNVQGNMLCEDRGSFYKAPCDGNGYCSCHFITLYKATVVGMKLFPTGTLYDTVCGGYTGESAAQRIKRSKEENWIECP